MRGVQEEEHTKTQEQCVQKPCERVYGLFQQLQIHDKTTGKIFKDKFYEKLTAVVLARTKCQKEPSTLTTNLHYELFASVATQMNFNDLITSKNYLSLNNFKVHFDLYNILKIIKLQTWKHQWFSGVNAMDRE